MILQGGKKTGIWLCLILSAAVILTTLPWPVPLYAESLTEEGNTDYIVKYRDSENILMDDDTMPFDVVGQKQLERLIRQDALEWYEIDGDAVLMDNDFSVPEACLMESASDYYDTEAQWNLSVINAEKAFRNGTLGQGIRVGVVDSGINPHPDFGGRLLPGHNFMKEAKGNAQKESDTSDEYGHGTRVAGLIAAAGEEGYIGAAPAVELVPLKCTDGKSVKISAICNAIFSGIKEYDCDVLNLSLGVQTEHESLREAIEYAAEQNVVVVSAVGNGGTSDQYYPASYETVIGVGSVDRNGDLYKRSNHNASVFLTSPGVSVRSTDARGGYSESTGCSFAIPQVSAAAAVMLGIDGTLTPEEIMQILSETAFDRGEEGYDEYFGYGILNLGGCVAALKGNDGEEDPSPGPPDPSQPPDPSDGADEWDTPVEVTDPEDDTNPSDNPVPPDTTDPGNAPGPSNRPSDSSGNPGSSDTPSPVQPQDPSVDPVTPPEPQNPSEDPGRNSVGPSAPQEQGYSQCPKDSNCPLAVFSDLDRSAWYHDAVHYTLEEGILNGFTDRTFRPGQNTSRAMIVTMLWRMEGSPQMDGSPTFKDVPDGQWYTDAIRWAAFQKIVSGYSVAVFAPDDNVTREQLAVILHRYAAYLGLETGGSTEDRLGYFRDTEQISSWALDAMRWATGSSLVNGMGNDQLAPRKSASRAEVAQMLLNFGQSAA